MTRAARGGRQGSRARSSVPSVCLSCGNFERSARLVHVGQRGGCLDAISPFHAVAGCFGSPLAHPCFGKRSACGSAEAGATARLPGLRSLDASEGNSRQNLRRLSSPEHLAADAGPR